MKTPALELKGLSKRFGGVVALEGADLKVESGEFLVLLGPSGCGKSTALRCVAGLETPSSGDVLIEGRSVLRLEPKDRDVAMVFQNYALYPHMEVRRNLAFPLKMRSTPLSEIDAKVQEVSRLLRIERLLERRPGQLSGGQRQRVAIGRAIVRDPKLFLFDEPLSNLDAKLRNEMRLEIARLHRTLRTTIVYVTHDQVEAMTLATRIVVLNEGKIEQIGSPEDVYARPATRFVAGFVGTPTMNFISGRIENGRFEGSGVELVAHSPHVGSVELGIRPEDVRLDNDGWSAEVELMENVGADRYAHLRCGETRLVARVPAGTELAEGSRVHVSPTPEKLHLFSDGKRISLEAVRDQKTRS